MERETSADDSKRKRNSPEGFKRSKRTHRTPTKKDSENPADNMEEVKDMLRDIMKEIKNIREEQDIFKKEILEIKRENKDLKETVRKLENKIESLEKKERKNNIIIRGANIEQISDSIKVSQLLKDKIEVDIKVKSVQIINKGSKPLAVAHLDNWEDKIKIMRNKNRLRQTEIYIENDMTAEEREVQAKIRKLAKEERDKGKKTIVKYRKVIIDGVTLIWDQNKEMLTATPKN